MNRLSLWPTGVQSIWVPPPPPPTWETVEHISYLFHPKPSLVLHWLRVAPGYINSSALPACPTLPSGQRKPWGRKAQVFVFETGKHVCHSCRWPPEWGERTWKGTNSFCYICFWSQHFLVLTKMQADWWLWLGRGGGLTALYKQSNAAGEAVELGLVLGEEQRNWSQATSGFGPSSATY